MSTTSGRHDHEEGTPLLSPTEVTVDALADMRPPFSDRAGGVAKRVALLMTVGCMAFAASYEDGHIGPGASFAREAEDFSAATTTSVLLGTGALSYDCLGFPEQDFSTENCIDALYEDDPHAFLAAGEPAIDFSLETIDGESVSLSQLLESEGKPVCLIYGMFSCGVYQGDTIPHDGVEGLEAYDHSAEYSLVEAFADSVTFLHVYTTDPHPTSPNTNFQSGEVSEKHHSLYAQAFDYDDRVAMAALIEENQHPESRLVVDALGGGAGLSNPVMCSYGLGPRMAFLIDADGTVVAVHDWLNTLDMADEIEALLAEEGDSEATAAAARLRH